MKCLKKSFRYILFLLIIPVFYILISLVLTSITVNESVLNVNTKKVIYLNTNGVHLDIIIPVLDINDKLMSGLEIKGAKYLSFGWGDENFYLNTPSWNDLTFKNAFSALFLNSKTLIHLTKYSQRNTKWTVVNLNEEQLLKLNKCILNSFKLDKNDAKMILKHRGYSFNDDFYKANGSYSCFKTCNSWVNSVLKESDLKSCYWTPFDFGVINKYKD